jgi:hypothetical protein
MEIYNYKSIIGKTITKTEYKHEEGSGLIECFIIYTDTFEKFMWYNSECSLNDCSIILTRVKGNLDNLLNSPLIKAEEYIEVEELKDKSGDIYEQITWSIVTLATEKGEVVFSWAGRSNGYYCEEISFEKQEIR